MIHFITSDVIIPATPSNPQQPIQQPYVFNAPVRKDDDDDDDDDHGTQHRHSPNLVGGIPTPLKNMSESQIGSSSQLLGFQ